MTNIDASIVIPTFRRNDGLENAIRSCFMQAGISDLSAEILVVDNDPHGGAKDRVVSLQATAPLPLRYVHAPTGGVAGARNAGIRESFGDCICFLDDDEVADSDWLAALVGTQRQTNADVVFGPVVGNPETRDPRRFEFCRQFFSRTPGFTTGTEVGFYGTGNSLLLRHSCVFGPEPFDLRLGQIGGEDSIFFRELQQRGRRFVWSAEAVVYELVPNSRCTVEYLLWRSFKRGQWPSILCAWQNPPNFLGIVSWMAIGAGQATVYGALALCLAITKPSLSLRTAGRALEGLGKLFWMPPFRRPMVSARTSRLS